MKHLLAGIFAIWAGSGGILLGADEGSEDSGYYVFVGADLRLKHKSTFVPVLAADRKGVYVETAKGKKRVRYTTECRFAPRLGLSNDVMAISGLDFDFDYLKQGRLETNAVSDMFRAEANTEMEVVRLGGGILGGRVSAEAQDRISDLKDRQDNMESNVRMDLEDGAYEGAGLSDYIYAQFMLQPRGDVKDAFCAMVVRYLREDSRERGGVRKAWTIHMKKVGDLLGGVPNKVKFGYKLPEGIVSEDGIELFFFSGEGEPLATNMSKGLYQLSWAEVEKFRARQAGDS